MAHSYRSYRHRSSNFCTELNFDQRSPKRELNTSRWVTGPRKATLTGWLSDCRAFRNEDSTNKTRDKVGEKKETNQERGTHKDRIETSLIHHMRNTRNRMDSILRCRPLLQQPFFGVLLPDARLKADYGDKEKRRIAGNEKGRKRKGREGGKGR